MARRFTVWNASRSSGPSPAGCRASVVLLNPARMGMQSFWIYDCLYDMPEMERLARVAHAAGADPVQVVGQALDVRHARRLSVHVDGVAVDLAR